MSGNLEITFARGTPTVAVDVVAPDQHVVERLMMAEGERRVVAVPSEASFLRVHLPSGRTVILTDPGNLNRTITAAHVGPPASAPTAPERRDADPAESATPRPPRQ